VVALLAMKPTALMDAGVMYILDAVILDVVFELMVHGELESAVSVLTAVA
jgi:hypothetical protein